MTGPHPLEDLGPHCDHALEIRTKWPANVWGVRRPKVDIVHCRIQTNISLIEVLHIILTFGSIFDIGLLTSLASAAFLPAQYGDPIGLVRRGTSSNGTRNCSASVAHTPRSCSCGLRWVRVWYDPMTPLLINRPRFVRIIDHCGDPVRGSWIRMIG